MSIKARDLPAVQEARRAAHNMLAYYRAMLAAKEHQEAAKKEGRDA